MSLNPLHDLGADASENYNPDIHGPRKFIVETNEANLNFVRGLYNDKIKPYLIDFNTLEIIDWKHLGMSNDVQRVSFKIKYKDPLGCEREIEGDLDDILDLMDYLRVEDKADRVTVNVETFCGECYFCKKGYVNNCTDQNGGWALGCRIDGGQAEYVRVPFADQGLNKIPDEVTERQALFVGDVLATGYWATRISEITEDDTVLIIGAGPTGICTLLCVMLKSPKHIIMCEKDEERIQFINKHYPDVLTVSPEECEEFVKKTSDHGGADVVLEVAGAESTFRLAWECARPNAIVTIVALYDKAQRLPLPDMYGKNLIFKTGGVDGCDCDETLQLIADGKINTEPLITHTYPLSKIDEAYDLFENKRDGVIKVAVECWH